MQVDFEMPLVFAIVVLVGVWCSYCGASVVAVLVYVLE